MWIQLTEPRRVEKDLKIKCFNKVFNNAKQVQFVSSMWDLLGLLVSGLKPCKVKWYFTRFNSVVIWCYRNKNELPLVSIC